MTTDRPPLTDEVADAHRLADEWKDCVLVCACGWRVAATTKTQTRKDWIAHRKQVKP